MPNYATIAALLSAAPLTVSALAPAAVPTTPTVVTTVAAPTPPAPVPAQVDPALVSAAAALKAGDFSWADGAGGDAPVLIAVSIADQKLYAFRGGTLFAVSTVSTGRPGHSTPTGVFPITEKHRVHHSNKYNNAPMPFMQRLTNDGVALHAGHIPGRPASHGCVRLPLAFAEKLFGVTSRGGMVVITDQPLAAVAARQVVFDGKAVQAAPVPAPAPVMVAAAPAPVVQPSMIAVAYDATVGRLQRWAGQ